jgi:uncharacterized Rmd1/YagE family protein
VTEELFGAARTVRAVAWCIGERIDVRALERGESLATSPLSLRAGAAGLVIIFRYGAVVLFNQDPIEEAALLDSLGPFVRGPFEDPESDEADIHIDPDGRERVDPDGTLVLREASVERLQVVAHVLAKSAVLAHYESGVSDVLERVEPTAQRLRRAGRSGMRGRQIIRDIGDVLVIQTRTVGRVEVAEQPEMTWDDPPLERLYARLSEEYDLRERDRILERKLALVARNAETLLDLLQNRRILRVEWYIVLLIAVEIVLIVYDMLRTP